MRVRRSIPDKIVSIAVKDVDVRAALKQLLAADKVEIEIRDGKIYLSPSLAGCCQGAIR